MDITLQKKVPAEYITNYTVNGEYTTGHVEHFKDTDYTGRWKIININEVPNLYIECFELEDYTSYELTGEETRLEEIEGNWFQKLFGIKYYTEIKTMGKIEHKRLRAYVEWIHEDDLNLAIETINVCECEEKVQ